MRLIIVTGGEATAAAVADLAASLKPCRSSISFAMGCLDFGLEDVTRAKLAAHFDTIVNPAWPYPRHAALENQPHARATATAPFLPDLFAGFDAYVWIGPDAFVQTPSAIALLRSACLGNFAAVIPALDRSYNLSPRIAQSLHDGYREAFGPEVAQRMGGPYVTANVVAAAAGSPLWQAWRRSMQTALDHSSGASFPDITPLNHALRTSDIPHHRLPAICNWQSNLALPMFDCAAGCLVEPSYPFDPLWIVANNFDDKAATHTLARKEGGTLACKLTCAGVREVLASQRAETSA